VVQSNLQPAFIGKRFLNENKDTDRVIELQHDVAGFNFLYKEPGSGVPNIEF